MRHVVRLVVVGFFVAGAMGAGCAAGNKNTSSTTGSGGSSSAGVGGATSSSGSPTSTSSGMGGTVSVGAGGAGGDSCAKFTDQAKQAPAAIVFALDSSASMNDAGKWAAAQQAVATAIDTNGFDNVTLGLIAGANMFTSPPKCLCDFIDMQLGPGSCQVVLPNGVACGVPGLPAVQLLDSGTAKSNAPMGVRHDIYQWLLNHAPTANDPSDGSPVYDLMKSGYFALQNAQNVQKRVLVLITDGGFSCASVAMPARPNSINDKNGCKDWEGPDDTLKLVKDNYADPNTPINTFFVGVPGSDSNGQMQGMYDTAPYHMRRALSEYAVAGSPNTVDPMCDKSLDQGMSFNQMGPDPLKPCHFDLTQGNFNTKALVDALNAIRGKALGCVYDLPTPPMGQMIDKGLVNVIITVNGMKMEIPKRKDMNDTCAMSPCWDYDANGRVVLIGAACDEVSMAMDAKVDIEVGCSTILK